MKKKVLETIASALIGFGLLGAIIFAESIGGGLETFLTFEGPCLGAVLLGAIIGNKTAETEAPAANTMKGGKTTANS